MGYRVRVLGSPGSNANVLVSLPGPPPSCCFCSFTAGCKNSLTAVNGNSGITEAGVCPNSGEQRIGDLCYVPCPAGQSPSTPADLLYCYGKLRLRRHVLRSFIALQQLLVPLHRPIRGRRLCPTNKHPGVPRFPEVGGMAGR